MAIFKKSALISDISGSVSGTTFLSAGSNSSIRARGNRSGNRTASQSRFRNSFAFITSAWRNLSDASRLKWYSQAPDDMNGYTFFCQVNTRVLWSGGTIIQEPFKHTTPIQPDISGLFFSVALEYLYVFGGFPISSVLPNDWAAVVLGCVTAPNQTAPSNRGKYKYFCSLDPGADLSAVNFYPFAVSALGQLSEGTAIHLRFVFVNRLSGETFPDIYASGQGFALDPDALKFLEAAQISNLQEITATNTAFVNLKSGGFYSDAWDMSGYSSTYKCFALYPYLGSAAQHAKFNMCNPIDSNAAFRLSFIGDMIFTNIGAESDGATGYARTHLNLSTVTGLNDVSAFLISASPAEFGNVYDLGCFDSNLGNVAIYIQCLSNDVVLAVADAVSPYGFSESDGSGFFAISKYSANDMVLNVRGVNFNVTRAGIDQPDLEQFIFSVNFNGSPFSRSPRPQSFTGFAQGLTPSVLNSLRSILNTYMADLSRI